MGRFSNLHQYTFNEQLQGRLEETINMIVITIEQNENETPLQSSTASKKKANKGRNKAPQSVTICGQNGVALELKFQNKDESSTKVNVLIEDYDFRRLQISGMNRSQFKLEKCTGKQRNLLLFEKANACIQLINCILCAINVRTIR